MYWLPLIARIGNCPKSLVNNVARGTSRKISVLVGAVSASKSSLDSSRFSLALEASSAFAAVAHCVDRRPLRTCVMCPSTVGVAFVGQYLATLAALRPGNDWKFPALTAWRREDLTGDPMVQWRYSISFFCRWQIICPAMVLCGARRLGYCSGASCGGSLCG